MSGSVAGACIWFLWFGEVSITVADLRFAPIRLRGDADYFWSNSDVKEKEKGFSLGLIHTIDIPKWRVRKSSGEHNQRCYVLQKKVLPLEMIKCSALLLVSQTAEKNELSFLLSFSSLCLITARHTPFPQTPTWVWCGSASCPCDRTLLRDVSRVQVLKHTLTPCVTPLRDMCVCGVKRNASERWSEWAGMTRKPLQNADTAINLRWRKDLMRDRISCGVTFLIVSS